MCKKCDEMFAADSLGLSAAMLGMLSNSKVIDLGEIDSIDELMSRLADKVNDIKTKRATPESWREDVLAQVRLSMKGSEATAKLLENDFLFEGRKLVKLETILNTKTSEVTILAMYQAEDQKHYSVMKRSDNPDVEDRVFSVLGLRAAQNVVEDLTAEMKAA